jgi:hypothetical protein
MTSLPPPRPFGVPPPADPPDPANLPIVVTPPPADAIPEMFATALPDDIVGELRACGLEPYWPAWARIRVDARSRNAPAHISLRTVSRPEAQWLARSHQWRPWVGWQLDLFGLLTGAFHDEGHPHPYFRWVDPWDHHEVIVQLWSIVAHHGTLPLTVEWRWHTTYDPFTRIVRAPAGHSRTPREVKVTQKAEARLRSWPSLAGRPTGRQSKYPTRESYVAAIHTLYKRADRSVWSLAEAKDTMLARWLSISYKTFQARNDTYEITSDDIRNRRV